MAERYRSDSQFMGFEECPNCGSSKTPALARYSDHHAFCFSCHYYEPSSFFSVPFNSRVSLTACQGTAKETAKNSVRPLPEKASSFLSIEAREWLKQYGVTEEEVDANRLLWDENSHWLIFPYYREGSTLISWQARNFSKPSESNPKPKKWLSFGPIGDILHIIKPKSSRYPAYQDTIILVEDIISAIKVGRYFNSMPIFGSHVPLKTIVRLKDRFKEVGLWLDNDKEKESFQTASRASQFMDAFVVSKILDPKEHDDMEIINTVLRNHADDFPKGVGTI